MRKIILALLLAILTTTFLNAGVRVIKLDRSGLPELKVFFQSSVPVVDVNKENFSVFFNDTERSAVFKKLSSGRIPQKSVILIDASFSISPAKRNKIRDAAKKLVDSMRDNDATAVFTFNDGLIKLSDFSSDKKQLKSLIDKFQPAGNYSRMYDAIAAVDRFLEQRVRDEQKTVILFSDGFDEGSLISIEECIRITRESRLPVYSFGFTNVNRKHLENLKKVSSASGGLYSEEDNEDFTSVLFRQMDENIFEISFSIINPQTENYILIKNKKTGETVRIRLLMSLPELQQARKNIEKAAFNRRIFYGLGLLLLILLIILAIIILRRKKRAQSGNDLIKKILPGGIDTLLLTEGGKPVYLDEGKGIYKANLDEDDKELIAKAIMGQINKNVAKTIEYYKELFPKNILEKTNFTSFTQSITDYLNSTTAFTLDESKSLYRIVEILKTDISEYDAKYAINDLVGEEKYLRIISVLKQKSPADYIEPTRRVSEYVPLLNDVFKSFNEELQDNTGFGIDNFFNQDEDRNFELISDLLFSYGSGLESDKLLRELMELDSEEISKLLPFMIQVVKDSEGIEKDANFNMLRRMAQSLNLNVDNLSDIDALDAWWKNNKSGAAKQQNENKQERLGQPIPNGFNFGDIFAVYVEENGKIEEFSGKISGGDRYSVVFTTKKKLLLDSIMCTYKPDLPVSDNILRVNEHTLFRLVEITRIEDNLFQHHVFFITPNQKSEEDIKGFISLMFGGLK